MSVVAAFEVLADEQFMVLPGLMRHLLATQRTVYGPDWSSTWRTRCLQTPPPLISCSDFEWLTADDSRNTIEEWLNPAFQHGRRYLPFAQSGAGDAWCLVPVDEESPAGVALIRHDTEMSELGYRSFSDFVCVQFLQAFSDMDHLVASDGFSAEEACQIVRADALQVAQGMNTQTAAWLQSLCNAAPKMHGAEEECGTLPRPVLSLISAPQLATELARFAQPDTRPWPVVARWNCARHAEAPTPAAPTDWRTLARMPGRLLAAARAYQKEHGCNLAQAKAAVDRHLREGVEHP